MLLNLLLFVLVPIGKKQEEKKQSGRFRSIFRTLSWETFVLTDNDLKARANARNIVGQQDATLLGPTCCERLHTMLCVVACCCDLLQLVG